MKAPGGKYLWAVWSKAQVCGLAAQGRNQVISASKRWGLRDCQSLAESWSTWMLGCSPRRNRTVVLPGVVPNTSKPSLPDLVLGLLRERKGHHDIRQCNSSQIKHGEKR